MSDSPSPGPKKRRISRACDYCHQRSKRCRVNNSGQRCQNCAAFDQPCTFDRPRKRRGAPRRSNDSNQQDGARDPRVPDAACTKRSTTNVDQTELHGAAPPPTGSIPSRAWRSPRHYNHATILDLVELFFEVVYPIFPLFHQPSFLRRISRTEYTSDPSLFSVTMAVCALVSARVRDGAVFNPRWDLPSLQDPRPEVYYNEAIRQLSGKDLNSDVNTLRTHAILALAAIQDGKVRDMHEHLGRYHTVVAIEGLHDENNWPKEIGLVEMEERRRLFWSIYTLDIFTSIVWGGVIRSREYQSSVSYPSETDDDMFDDAGFASTSLSLSGMDASLGTGQSASWMTGRNFVIDLYRVLEHIMMRLSARKSRAQRQTLVDEVLQVSDFLSQEAVLNSVMQMYADLPRCLKATNPVTSKPRLDRFGFQAADIIATVHLLRMVVCSATGATISEKCQIAHEVVNAFIAIPTAYHHAISVPLLFHLGVIGQILATTLEQPLSETDYNSIRDVMMAMVQLLSTLEGLHASKGASHRLKDQITRMDEYMTLQRHSGQTKHARSVTMEPPAQLEQEMPQSTLSSGGIDDTLALSPFQVPPQILGDFSQLFDFSHLT